MKIVTHSTKKIKKFKYVLRYVGGGIIALGIFIAIAYHTIYKKNTSYFLNTLKKYETSKKLLVKAWPYLASKAKTSVHYLMLLKRLHAYNLHKPYEKVLIRALWKYKNINSVVALGAEYFLQQYSIENNEIIAKNTHDSVIHKELKKFLDDTIDILWKRYPNIVRLYYIVTNFEVENKSAYSQFFSDDELLRLYKKLYFHHESWQDYKKLWELTGERAFLYLFIVYAKQVGETSIAQNTYKTFLKTYYTSSYTSQDAAIVSYLSLIIQDISMLLNIAERATSEETLLNLASAYIYIGKRNEAWNMLEKYNKVIQNQNHSEIWDSVYFWLATRSDLSSSTISTLFQKLHKKYSNSHFLVYEYWIYLYKKNTQILDTSLFPNDFFHSPKVAFLAAEKKHKESSQPSLTALWRAYNTDENLQFWKHILASYFLRYRLYDEFSLLQKKHENDIDMLPYEFFLSVKRYSTTTKNSLLKKFTNTAKSFNNYGNMYYEFPWWHYYNVAVQYNTEMDYENAQSALQKAESLYRASYHRNEYHYMPYIWIQHAYAAKGENDTATMQTFISKIRKIEPTFVYLQRFENY